MFPPFTQADRCLTIGPICLHQPPCLEEPRQPSPLHRVSSSTFPELVCSITITCRGIPTRGGKTLNLQEPDLQGRAALPFEAGRACLDALFSELRMALVVRRRCHITQELRLLKMSCFAPLGMPLITCYQFVSWKCQHLGILSSSFSPCFAACLWWQPVGKACASFL